MKALPIAFILVLVLILAGCAPSLAADPYTAQAWASGAIQATQAAQQERAAAATLRAGELRAGQEATAAAWSYGATATQAAAQATAQAAQATATAQALQVQGTATAGAALEQTATAYPPQATATQAALNELVRLDTERERAARWAAFVAPIQAIAPTALFFVALVLILAGAVLAYRRLMPVLELRLRTLPRGPHDAPLVLFGLPGGRLLAYDADRNVGPAALLTPGGAVLSGLADPGLQVRVTSQDQAIDLVRGLPREEREQKRAHDMAATLLTQPGADLPQAQPQALPSVAPWQALTGWSGGPLPLGVGADGLILADPETAPHFLFAGTTGSGKTRAGLRPLAALALAAGWQVSIFDNSGLDFLPFRDHPNAALVRLADPAQAIGYLEALYKLIRERQNTLTRAGVSTWGRLPGAGPRVLGVFDEFSNLADSLGNADRENLWRAARMVAAEGRKAGVHLALALQDPTHRSIDLRIRRNMTPVSFRVRDADASRVVLNAPGAELLPGGQFLAGLGLILTRGVGFAPDDNELAGWLGARPAPALPAATWLELGSGSDLTQAPTSEAAQADTLHGCTADQVRQVCEMAQDGASQTTIETVVFGFAGGAAYRKVKAILGDPTAASWAGLDTTTTAGSPAVISL